MKINALLLDPKDNVVTCVSEVQKGEQVVYRGDTGILTVDALEDIPYCHKVALVDLKEGDAVIKYGEMIGKTNRPVQKGCWLNEHNVYSVPRAYDAEMI